MVEGATVRFVGRTAELEALRAALADVRAGHPRIVVVRGEPGIGKTALVRRFLRDAGRMHTLWVSTDEEELDLQFGVVEQLWAAMPAAVADTRAGPAGTDSLAAGAELLAGIGAVERRGPVVVVIDDLQWADGPSVRALLFVLRRLRRDRVLFLATARAVGLDRLGEGWARMLADHPRARVIDLAGLTAGQVRELAVEAERDLSASAGERLREHTAGNPLHVRALLTELPAEAWYGEVGELPAPHSYAATVLTRLTRLSRPAQDVVAATAVLGMRAPLRAVAAVAGVTDPVAAAEQAADMDLLLLAGGPSGGQVGFPHPLVRAAVYDNLPGAVRRGLHTAAARIMDGPARLRHRVAATGGVDEGLAAELRTAAERELTAGTLLRGISYLELASRVDPDPERADRCLCRASEALLLAGEASAATAFAARAHAGPPSAYRRYLQALLATAAGDLGGAMAGLHAVSKALSPAEDADLFARVAAATAYLHGLLGEDEPAIRWAARALAIPEAPVGVASLARQAKAWGYARAGRIREALGSLADCQPDRGRPGPFETELLAIRGVLHDWAGDTAAAIRDLHAVERWVRDGFPVSSIVHVHAALAEAELRSGAWDAAATDVELAVSLGEGLGHGWYLTYAHQVAALLYAVRGERRFAVAHAHAATRSLAAASSAEAMAYAALAAAHPAWVAGDWPATGRPSRPRSARS